MKDVIKVWKEKGKILEGIRNNIFKKADVEHIAAERMDICNTCPHLDNEGSKCMVPGTAPCCNEKKGGCGCSLSLKTRALSSDCPMKKWKAEMTEEEEDALNKKLGL